LSGNFSDSIKASHFSSVFTLANQKAVSLKTHLFFLESHHFTLSQLHHFSQFLASITSNLSTKFDKDKNV
jgi:hypothetical protein